ncbi:glucose-6-phosphate dehydrogenase [Bythopirellula polymerisocia]|uniref:Glucose-6-phosphate 1-dehydrogenase n=1 Tax=Bythopirellula polymerisocia TaxID=2528003 RepID=A0A5C6CHN2_9BACT|nr:glucose-6-phosphate dehydrogenase [Bythopirellula polymerisocia]TWU23535.1 Glucose-6-phosphate 1-dehydrogenase [Bythopirellula polymerisocia]
MAATIVIFGASGDLTGRKLIPALYQLFRKGRLSSPLNIVGVSRTKFSHDEWRTELATSTEKFAGDSFDQEKWAQFAERIYYQPGDIGQAEDFAALAKFVDEIEGGESGTRIYYLSTAPRFYLPAVEHLGQAGMACETNGPRRVVIEKPFGRDLKSAKELNKAVHEVFAEHQVYRIDHYLGKETVQNLLVLRFGNTIFEPIWNRNYIDHVQITVAEEVEVGSRAGYYDSAGVVRDMVQNHLLQLLMVTAMEAPVRYEADAIRNEKVKVLHAIRPLDAEQVRTDTFRGQYRGYTASEGVKPTSRTPTFAALKLGIDNWRWQGVPFYLRSGKAMSCRTTQIVIQFYAPPQKLFVDTPTGLGEANRLVIQVQPAEGIQLHFQTKVPDAGMRMRQTDLNFNYQKEFRGVMPEAYERLLLDALEGDASLFARADEVEAAWKICDPILEAWEAKDKPTLFMYDPGFWGPEECLDWMTAQGRQWFDTCPLLG